MGGIHPHHAAVAVMAAGSTRGRSEASRRRRDGGLVAGDTVEIDGPGRVRRHGYLGCLGDRAPASPSALLRAYPKRRIVQVTGDGAMGRTCRSSTR